MEKQSSFDQQLDSLTDLLSEMETRGPFNPKVQTELARGNIHDITFTFMHLADALFQSDLED